MKWLTLLCGTLLVTACGGDEVDPISKITGPRLLAITSEPSALPLGGQVSLSALVVDELGPRSLPGRGGPFDRPVSAIRWRACAPWRFIANPATDCVGAESLDLVPAPTGQMSVSQAQLEQAFPKPPDSNFPDDAWRLALNSGVEFAIPILAEVDVDGKILVARFDLAVTLPEVKRSNPAIAAIRFGDSLEPTLQAGKPTTITVEFVPESLDVDQDDPALPLEEVDAYFYSPLGEFSTFEVETKDGGLVTEPTTFTPGPAGASWIYVVFTDRSGGVSADWIPIEVN